MREFEGRSSSRAAMNAFRRVAGAAGNEESSQRLWGPRSTPVLKARDTSERSEPKT